MLYLAYVFSIVFALILLPLTNRVINRIIPCNVTIKEVLSAIFSALLSALISVIMMIFFTLQFSEIIFIYFIIMLIGAIAFSLLKDYDLKINKDIQRLKTFAALTIVFILLSIPFNTDFFKNAENCSKFQSSVNKSIKKLNVVINQSIKTNGINPSYCKDCNNNKESLAEFFRQNTDNINNYFETSTEHCLRRNYVGDYYKILKVNGKCGANDTLDPHKANCVMLIDPSGRYPVNKLSYGNKNMGYFYNDQYLVIIKAKEVVFAQNNTNNIGSTMSSNKIKICFNCLFHGNLFRKLNDYKFTSNDFPECRYKYNW